MKRNGKWFMLRITDRQRNRETQYKEILMKKIETFACAEEPDTETNNYHYHSIHQSKKTTLHERTVKLGWTGNENKAFSHLIEDTDEHWNRSLAYICKGSQRGAYPIIVVNTLELTEQQVWKYHYDWWDNWSKKKYSEVKKEKKIRNQLQDMYDAIPKQSFYEGPWKIAEEIIQYYQDNNKLEPNDFQLKCYLKSLIRKFAETQGEVIWNRFKSQRAKEIVGSEFRYDFFSSLKEKECVSQNSENQVDLEMFVDG